MILTNKKGRFRSEEQVACSCEAVLRSPSSCRPCTSELLCVCTCAPCLSLPSRLPRACLLGASPARAPDPPRILGDFAPGRRVGLPPPPLCQRASPSWGRPSGLSSPPQLTFWCSGLWGFGALTSVHLSTLPLPTSVYSIP